MSSYSLFVSRWKDCQQCDLSRRRSNVVMCRGTIPCDVLFVGEAPGISENALNSPFVGPVGRYMDQIIDEAVDRCHALLGNLPVLDIAFTNVVCCIPYDETGMVSKPEKVHIQACSQRLDEFVEIAYPKLIVTVGDVARQALLGKYVQCLHSTMMHPGAIYKMPVAQQGLAIKRCVVSVRDALMKIFEKVEVPDESCADDVPF